MTSSLSIDVFNSGYKPVPGAPKWDGKTPATWPASTSTLISGDREALLVDALMTVAEGERLAEWVQSSGKQPGAILVTHGRAWALPGQIHRRRDQRQTDGGDK